MLRLFYTMQFVLILFLISMFDTAAVEIIYEQVNEFE